MLKVVDVLCVGGEFLGSWFLEEDFHVGFADVEEASNGGGDKRLECEGFRVGEGPLDEFWGAEDVHSCPQNSDGVNRLLDFATGEMIKSVQNAGQEQLMGQT